MTPFIFNKVPESLIDNDKKYMFYVSEKVTGK